MEHVVEIFKALVQLAGHLVWPALIVFTVLFIARRISLTELREFILSIRNMKIGPGGFEISREVDAMDSKVASLDLKYEQLKRLVYKSVREELATAEPAQRDPEDKTEPAQIPAEVRRLADSYAAVDSPDWKVRVSQKEDLAGELGNFINTHNISRDALAKEEHKGVAVGLASAIISSPEAEDAERLFQIAQRSKWLHVKYRIVVALASLIQRRLLEPAQGAQAFAMLTRFETDQDRPPDRQLKRRIQTTRHMLEAYLEEQRA